jgi:hypothetical protein
VIGIGVMDIWRVELAKPARITPRAFIWHQLPFAMQQQEQSNWCWAAVGASVDQYYNPLGDPRQCTIATNQIGKQCCTTPVPADCNIYGFCDQALQQRGHHASTAGGSAAMAQVKTEIDAGRPLALRIAWNGGGAHFVVISGYQTDDAHIAVDDPGSASHNLVDYSAFPGSYGGGGTWTDTFYTQNGPITVGALSAPEDGAVHAVSRSADKLDIFATDSSGVVRTAAWEPNRGGWRGWWELKGGRAAPGAPVTAVSRSQDKLDVFVVGTDGHVYTAAWQPDFTDWWHGWWIASNVTVPAKAPINPAVRLPDHLDAFFVGQDQAVHLVSWSADVASGRWRG